MNISIPTMHLEDLLDGKRVLELNAHLALSVIEPIRFIAWCEGKRTLVVLDLDKGAIVRALAGPCETREVAEAAIAELQAAVH